MKVDEAIFEIGDIITGTPVSGKVYCITNELTSFDPRLFKKEEPRFTNFRR